MQDSTRPFHSRIFLSPDDNRFRSGWRIILQGSLLLFLLFFASIPYVILTFIGVELKNFDFMISIGISLAAITISIAISRKILDHRPFLNLGIKLNKYTHLDILVGFFIPALMMGLIFLVEMSFGWLKINNLAWNSTSIQAIMIGLGSNFFFYIAIAWQEEILSRGYHLQNLIEGLPVWGAVFASSLIFSALHILNPYASWRSLIGITLAGIFLCYSYLLTRQLWLPIGLHLGWNFFQGPIFGFPVSGTESFVLINQAVSGPEIITGGLFGPEAGIILLPSLLIGVILVTIYSKYRNKRKLISRT